MDAATSDQSSCKSLIGRAEYRTEDTLDEMSLNEITNLNSNSNSENIINSSNGNSSTASSSANRDDINENNYDELNEPNISLNEEKFDVYGAMKSEVSELIAQNEIYTSTKDNDDDDNDEDTESQVNDYGDDDDYDDEENNNQDLIDFIDKAKAFDANALDLSRKGIAKIPRKLLELNMLQASF